MYRGDIEFVGAMRDETAAKKAEVALRLSEEQWRDVFENNPIMYFMVDAAGNVMAVNPFGAEQLGYQVDELVGQPVFSFFRESDCTEVQTNFALCLEQLGRGQSWEFRCVRKDGTVLRVRGSAKAVARVNGPIVLIACEDITEQKRAEEALFHVGLEARVAERMRIAREMHDTLLQSLNGLILRFQAARNMLPGAPKTQYASSIALSPGRTRPSPKAEMPFKGYVPRRSLPSISRTCSRPWARNWPMPRIQTAIRLPSV